MYVKQHLSFKSLIKYFSKVFSGATDKRATNQTYSVHDTALSALACMYIQCPSLLNFQRKLKQRTKRSNLQTQFNVHAIPKDSQMRDILDKIPTTMYDPIFKEYLTRLQRGGQLSAYVFEDGAYLLPLDGTQYHYSTNIHCSQCLQQPLRNGETGYSHKVVQAAIVHPDHKQVIPVRPEEIKNTDGFTKQDCEINAAKRLMPILKKMHPRLSYIRLGDSLYATTPFINETLSQRDHFIFAVKPGDHQTLFDNMKLLDFDRYDEADKKGRKFIYKWCSQVPLTNDESSPIVNVLKLRISTPQSDGTNKVTYVGTWITDLAVTEKNIVKLVRGARCRWRIENECFNTFKNHGYEIDHNYGHGEKNLSFVFYVTTLLAFYLHQILSLCDQLYQAVRKSYGTLRSTWQHIQSAFNWFVYESWEAMLHHILNPDHYQLQRAGP